MLRDYQQQGVAFLESRDKALLCDDPGLGKTAQAIMCCLRKGLKTLVVCPHSIKDEWVREVRKWTDLKHLVIEGSAAKRALQYHEEADFYIVNYETVIRDAEAISAIPYNCIILDEAQRIKNRKTLTARTVKGLRLPRYRYILTATPIENSISDLYSLMEFTGNGMYYGLRASLTPTRGDYFYLDSRSFKPGPNQLRQMVSQASPEALHNALKRFMLRRRKEDVDLQLPPKTNMILETQLTLEQKAMYVLARDRFLLMVGDTTVPIVSVLAQLTYLREICNSTALVSPKHPFSSKFEELVPRVKEAVLTGNKVIVFSEFKRFCDLIVAALRKEGLGVSYLHGQEKCIGAQKEAFWGENQVLVATRTGEVGHNLQCASYVFEMEPCWNPARVKQRQDRAHRLGQTKPVLIYSFVTPGTVEERIQATLHNKEELFKEVIDRPEYRQWLRELVE